MEWGGVGVGWGETKQERKVADVCWLAICHQHLNMDLLYAADVNVKDINGAELERNWIFSFLNAVEDYERMRRSLGIEKDGLVDVSQEDTKARQDWTTEEKAFDNLSVPCLDQRRRMLLQI